MLSESILRLALDEVQKSECHPFKVAAVIFKGKRILSVGINQIRSAKRLPDRYMEWECSLHAEMSAILKCKISSCKRASILVVRQNKNGVLGMARPCEYCYASLTDANFKEMYYTGSHGEICYERIKQTLISS